MEPRFTMEYAKQIKSLRDVEIELTVTLAKFQAGAKLGQSGEEVR